MRFTVVAFVLCIVAFVYAETPVQKCADGKTPQDYKEVITVGNCQTPPCRLKKGRTVKAEFRFTPDRNVKSLKNTVNAVIVGLPFPFIGVDGTDACSLLYEADGTTKTGCPLQAGKEYVYKNQFDVLNIYPVLKLVVQWGLTANDGKDVMCFRLPARITN